MSKVNSKKWVMPEWMEKYREFFINTGGNSVEDLMNRDPREANVVINAPVALMCVSVESQYFLLMRLHEADLLK